MAESENVYVKIGERGRLIERTAESPRDHVKFTSLGWALKGSKGAPTQKDAWADEPVKSGLTDTVPTSVKAFAETVAEQALDGKKGSAAVGRGSSTSSAGGAADAKSQAAAS